jgi:hypothetical protein
MATAIASRVHVRFEAEEQKEYGAGEASLLCTAFLWRLGLPFAIARSR